MECGECGLGTWFQLKWECSAVMFPERCRACNGVFGRQSFFIIQEWFAEQGSSDET